MESDSPRPSGNEREKAALQRTVDRERRVVLVVNSRSRRGAGLFADAKRLLRERGFEIVEAHAVRDPKTLRATVEKAVDAGHSFVVVGGGDGSLSSVVDHFLDKPVVLGILPLGTANSFARTLGIPCDLDGAIGVIADGKVVDVDVGRIGGHAFANAAAIGLPALIGASIPHALKAVLGRVGYLLHAGWCLARYRGFCCTLVDPDGSRRRFDAVEVRISNGGYLGGMLVAETASVESRDLVVQIVKGGTRRAVVGAWVRQAAGIAPKAGSIETIRTHGLTIETEPEEPISIDGEVLARTPAEVSVARQALRLMVPADRHDLH